SPRLDAGIRLYRYPCVRRVAVLKADETRSGNTDNSERKSLDVNGLAKHRRIAAKTSAPIAIAENGDLSMVILVIRCESSSADDGNAQPGEEVSAHHVYCCFLGFGSKAHHCLVGADGNESYKVGEHIPLGAQVLKDRLREGAVVMSRLTCSFRLVIAITQQHQ